MSTATLSLTYGTFSAPAGTVVGGIVVTFTGTGTNVLTQTVSPERPRSLKSSAPTPTP